MNRLINRGWWIIYFKFFFKKIKNKFIKGYKVFTLNSIKSKSSEIRSTVANWEFRRRPFYSLLLRPSIASPPSAFLLVWFDLIWLLFSRSVSRCVILKIAVAVSLNCALFQLNCSGNIQLLFLSLWTSNFTFAYLVFGCLMPRILDI